MPAWSPEIANEFIRRAAADQRSFDQLQLQELVYIAHGWCLAIHGQPLTGDRPEAWEFGPIYARLADALAPYGLLPVTSEIRSNQGHGGSASAIRTVGDRSDLEEFEHDLIEQVYQDYGQLNAWQLSGLTRDGETPWKLVFSNGVGKFRDISHQLIKAQFVQIAAQSTSGSQTLQGDNTRK